MKLHKLSNNIVVVISSKEITFLGEIGQRIRKNKPYALIEEAEGPVEIYYEKDIEIIENQKTEKYSGIFKVL